MNFESTLFGYTGPEVFRFSADLEAEAGSDGDRAYILRPEVIESYYVMYRTTGNPIYREWAWDAAQQIERYCKAGPGRGYSGLRNTNNATNPIQDDVQQTFFLAETLKVLVITILSNLTKKI
jgi:mannosyl-oligosaccharide alpha-1,2-mannosidase